MRWFLNSVAVLMACSLMTAQAPSTGQASLGPPPGCAQDSSLDANPMEMLPPATPQGHVQHLKGLVNKEINRAMMSGNRPSLDAWQPMTAQEKFRIFVRKLYSPGTYARAGVDAVTDKFVFDDRAYEHRWMGLGQHYGVILVNGQTDVFLKSFLLPTLLKQDPRYYRNPSLTLSKRVLYSTSRVLITRSDRGSPAFNGSVLLGSAAHQALKDLYVPGERQGIAAIGSRLAFDLVQEAGSNLLHEFWPDMRRKFFHR